MKMMAKALVDNVVNQEGGNVGIGTSDEGKDSVLPSCKDCEKGNSGKWIWKTKPSNSDEEKAIERELELQEKQGK